MKFSKWLVIFIILSNIVFATVVLRNFILTGMEPMILTGVWFTFTGAELLALAKIKITEVRKERDYE